MKNIPKYKVVENYIINLIKSEELKSGDQIDTEKQLSDRFKFSPLTINKAIVNLSNQGYIKRIQGKGSFVTSTVITRNSSKANTFKDDMIAQGIKPGSKLICYNLIHASKFPKVAQQLQLDDDDLVHYFERIRTGDGIPHAIVYSYIPAKYVPSLDVLVLSQSDFSLKHYLQSIGIEGAGSSAILSAALPSEDQLEKLNINDCALLKNAHTYYDKNRVPYNYNETYYISSRYQYTILLGNMLEQDANTNE